MKNEEGRIKKGNIIKKTVGSFNEPTEHIDFQYPVYWNKKIGCLTTTDFQKQTT